MNIEDVIKAHNDWKTKLKNGITNQETFQVDAISADSNCVFGKWLYGEGKTKFGTLSSYAKCVVKHAAFHKEAGRIAALVNNKRYDEAESMLGPGTVYANASADVKVAINILAREANLK